MLLIVSWHLTALSAQIVPLKKVEVKKLM